MITSAEQFVRLRNSDVPAEYSLAAEDEAPVAVWLDVISRFPEMREWVAYNKTVPIEILAVLAHDESASVRLTVADKRKLTLELFDLLAHDQDELVRQRIAYNKKAPLQLLERLSVDVSPLVRDAAMKHLGKRGS
ncbi:hypothetical protein [Rhodanobacter spathiphylli]|uniref:hypothetical protein n=1 Tax=Rhodanobacter spathiphylli TaxID=347483 RepID=UPI0009FCC379|nr:hypothetical protein [Rhodanobacter spathiphylli]